MGTGSARAEHLVIAEMYTVVGVTGTRRKGKWHTGQRRCVEGDVTTYGLAQIWLADPGQSTTKVVLRKFQEGGLS